MRRVLVLVLSALGCNDSNTGLPQAESSPVTGPTMAVGTGAPSSHFVANGQSAYASWSSGSRYFYVFVSRGRLAQASETWLVYSVWDASLASYVEYGGGMIPNEDFHGGAARMRLATNTSASSNPGFARHTGAGGTLDLTWMSDGLSTWRIDGGYESRSPGYRYSQRGHTESVSATVEGSLIGWSVSGTVSGNLGKNHNVTIQFF